MIFLPLPEDVQFLLSRLENCGYASYVVGGCVRDLLRKENPADWDIATVALPWQVQACFPEVPVIATGIRFGGVTVVLPSGRYEVTTLRKDGFYTDGRRPKEITFSGNICEDLSRRDFTVNAMAYRPLDGLCDPFGGRKDLQYGILRCVGDGDVRLLEDVLRVLRCLRFSATLGFDIAEDTGQSIRRAAIRLTLLPPERVLQEWLKLLAGSFAGDVLDRFPEVCRVLLPECMPFSFVSRWKNLPADPLLRMSSLLLDQGETQQTEILTRLRYPTRTRQRILFLCRQGRSFSGGVLALRRLLSVSSVEDVRRAVLLRYCFSPEEQAVQLVFLEDILQRGDCCRLKDLALTGHDLYALGFRGPALGAVQRWLLDAVINGQLKNEREVLLTQVKSAGSLQ